MIPGATTSYGASYGAMPTYGASYGTGYSMPMTTGYSAPMSYGGYSGYGQPAMDEGVVNQQLEDAKKVLSTQYKVQTDMMTHQYTAQLNVLEAQKNRQVQTDMMTHQYTA